jgi:hypothetical protein
MNARLIELAEQAGITTNLDTDYFERDMNKWVDYYSEKFAELIVQECKDIAFRRGDNVDYLSLQLINNEVDDARADMDAQIKDSGSRFRNFAEDWDAPGMEAYDDIDALTAHDKENA